MQEHTGKIQPTVNPSTTQLILRSNSFFGSFFFSLHYEKVIDINYLFCYQLEITAGTLVIKINLHYFHITWFLNQFLAALRIIHDRKMKLWQLRPMLQARQQPTGYSSYSETIRTLEPESHPLTALTHNSYRTYELSISIPLYQEIKTR